MKEYTYEDFEKKMLSVLNGRLLCLTNESPHKFSNPVDVINHLYRTESYGTSYIGKDGRKSYQETGGSRSFLDMFKLMRHYFPKLSLTEAMDAVNKCNPVTFGRGILSYSFCSVVRKIVFGRSPYVRREDIFKSHAYNSGNTGLNCSLGQLRRFSEKFEKEHKEWFSNQEPVEEVASSVLG